MNYASPHLPRPRRPPPLVSSSATPLLLPHSIPLEVAIFPTSVVCRSFYMELLRWPSRYRYYFCLMQPHAAAAASGTPDWRQRRACLWDLHAGESVVNLQELALSIRNVLEMKGMARGGAMLRQAWERFSDEHPTETMPAAPLLAMRVTSAGGRFSRLIDGVPQVGFMKVGYATESCNVYSNKIVVVDEAHNLVRSRGQYAGHLANLRELLTEADDSIVVGFTATPMQNSPREGRHLLDIIKGSHAPAGDEGFLASFGCRPRPSYPRSLPEGVPEAAHKWYAFAFIPRAPLENKFSFHS